MQKSFITQLILCIAILAGSTACGSSFVIHDVDYSQPVESVLVPDSDNMVHDQRYSVKFSVSGLLEEEGAASIDELRMIRNHAGFYYLTANGFQNVYIFEPGEQMLELVEMVRVSESGLSRPAFNQRGTYIELIDRSTGETFNLE
jgi:hypothetical protein